MGLTKVDLKGLNDGTDGQIITYDANGNPVAVGPGTDGQVLTSTGAGSPPAFEDAVSEGTQVKSTGESGGTKFLREDGDGTCSWQTLPSSGATLSGSTDNTVVTVTGSNAMQGEANLTFDGGTLQQAIDANDEGYTILADGNHRPTIVGDRDATGQHDELLHLVGKWNNTQVGAIDIQAGSDTSNKDDGHICFYTSSSGGSLNNRLKIHNGGDIEVKTGNVVIGTDGKGIDFSAAGGSAGGSSSAILDDYEEGTWTPVPTFGGGNTGAAYGGTGTYIKAGRIVTAGWNVVFTAKGSSTGQFQITGLPFTPSRSGQGTSFGYIHRVYTNYAGQLCAYTSGTTLWFGSSGIDGNFVNWDNDDLRNDTHLQGVITFIAN